MLSAHHLDNAMLLYETDDVIVYTGSYKQTAIALVSMGFDHGAVADFISEAKKLGIEEILYIGECTSSTHNVSLRSVILADGGDRSLTERTRAAAARNNYLVSVQTVSSHGGAAQDQTGIADVVTNELYSHAGSHNIATLSILTVSENNETGEKMEENERRSRLYPAALLVFESFAL